MKYKNTFLLGLAWALAGSAATAQDHPQYKSPVPPRFSQPTTSALGVDEVSPGFPLYQPMFDTTVLLIDESGTPVHTWPGASIPGLSVYLLESGNLLRTSAIAAGPGGGADVHQCRLQIVPPR